MNSQIFERYTSSAINGTETANMLSFKLRAPSRIQIANFSMEDFISAQHLK